MTRRRRLGDEHDDYRDGQRAPGFLARAADVHSGRREGEREPVSLTFLPDGVVVHADEVVAENGQLPRGIGEWTVAGDRFSYWFNVVLNDPPGRPVIVVYVHGEGRLAPDGRTFTGSGGSEIYAGGELLATNRADGGATRVRPSFAGGD